MAPSASGSFSAINNGAFVPDPHTGTPALDPSPVVVTAWFSGKGAAMGLYNLYLKYTYIRQ